MKLIWLFPKKSLDYALGHASGDEALVRVAKALQEARRESDGLFRLGGDEFAIVLPRTTEDRAVRAAHRYAKTVQAIGIKGLTLGVNIGIAVYPQDGSNKEALLRLADERMYAAKERHISVLDPSDVVSHDGQTTRTSVGHRLNP